MSISNELLVRAELYAKSKSILIISQPVLGHGSDGTVWRTSRNTALKILIHEKNFQSELECYRRLQLAGVREIDDFAVPYLRGFDESLLAIEMTIVNPPYVLDFGKVYLDKPPPYWGDEQLMKNAQREWREMFGADWRLVSDIVSTLRTRFGIYYVDPRPSNINTGREAEDDVGLASDWPDDEMFGEEPPTE
jgi:hypothetical protein